jgi:hypothetical protein
LARRKTFGKWWEKGEKKFPLPPQPLGKKRKNNMKPVACEPEDFNSLRNVNIWFSS